MRRANIMVSGVHLQDTRGDIVTLGGVRVRIYGETRPCEQMDAQVPGLTAALDPDWNGGVFGVVLNDGDIHVGDDASIETSAVEPVEDPAAEARRGNQIEVTTERARLS